MTDTPLPARSLPVRNVTTTKRSQDGVTATRVEDCSHELGSRKRKIGESRSLAQKQCCSAQVLSNKYHNLVCALQSTPCTLGCTHDHCRHALGVLAKASNNGAIAPPLPLSEKETKAFARELHTVNVGNAAA